MNKEKKFTSLRNQLAKENIIVAPGCYDAFSAMLTAISRETTVADAMTEPKSAVIMDYESPSIVQNTLPSKRQE